MYASSLFLPHIWMRDFVWIWISLFEELNQLKKPVDTNITIPAKLSFWKEAFNDNQLHGLPISKAFSEWSRESNPYSPATVRYRIKKLIKYYEEQYLSKRQFLSIEEMEEFGELVYSGLFYCIASSSHSNDLMHSISHLGKSYGIAYFIKEFPRHTMSLKQCYLPSQILFKHGFSHDSFIDQVSNPNSNNTWTNVIYDIASLSNSHLSMASSINQSFHPFVIPLKMFLSRLEYVNFNPIDHHLYPRSWHIRLLYNLFKQSLSK